MIVYVPFFILCARASYSFSCYQSRARALLNRIVCVNFCLPSEPACVLLRLLHNDRTHLSMLKRDGTSSCQFPELGNMLARRTGMRARKEAILKHKTLLPLIIILALLNACFRYLEQNLRGSCVATDIRLSRVSLQKGKERRRESGRESTVLLCLDGPILECPHRNVLLT